MWSVGSRNWRTKKPKMARIMWAVWTRHESFNGDDALRFVA
jgi:hypothetical protein